MERKLKMRVLIAKPGLGGHDRRAKQIAQGLRDQGFEVIFTGLRQTPSQIVDAALLQEVDAVGLSLPDSSPADLPAQVKQLLASQGILDMVLFGFGSIREEDIPTLTKAGLETVFLASASVDDMADFLRRRLTLTGTY
ncbi:MAG: cobalamin-dependent protein [Clostridia bacterium]|nr:cobalamin-dependent protein [Clostridia bacterium]